MAARRGGVKKEGHLFVERMRAMVNVAVAVLPTTPSPN